MLKNKYNIFIILITITILLSTLSITNATTYILDDFEDGTVNAWDTTDGTVTVDTASAYEGTYGLNATHSGAWTRDSVNILGSWNEVYVASWVEFDTVVNNIYFHYLNTAVTGTISVGIGGSADEWTAWYHDDGGWHYTESASTTIEVDTWYFAVLYAKIGDGDGEYRFWINGVSMFNVTGLSNSADGNMTKIQYGAFDWDVDSFQVYHDNCQLDSEMINFATNEAPVNNNAQLTNPDDTNNMYAQLREYLFTVNVTDADDNLADIDMTIQTGGATERITINFDVATTTFSEASGDTTKWSLITGSCAYDLTGNNYNLTIALKPEFNATEESDLDIKIVSTDDEAETDTDTYDVNYDVITNLVVTGLTCDDERGNIGATITFTGTVYYANNPSSTTATTFYPPDAEFTSISIYDDWNNNEGTDSTIVNGAFSVAFTANTTVGLETYNPYIDMADVGYTDGEENITDTFIADNIIPVFSVDSTTPYTGTTVNFTTTFTREYDDSNITSFSYTINRNETSFENPHTTTTFTDTNSSSVIYIYDFIGITDSTYGITSFTDPSNITIAWGNIIISIQVRDVNQNNLARMVTLKGTLPSGATLNQNTNSNGYYQLSCTNGTFTIYTWWNNIIVDTQSYTAITNSSLNLDTEIEKISSDDYYILLALNNTNLVTPTLKGTDNIEMLGISGTGTKTIIADNINWRKTDSPQYLTVDGSNLESDWTYESNIISYNLDLTTDKNLVIVWNPDEGSSPPSSSSNPPSDTTTSDIPSNPVTSIIPDNYFILPEAEEANEGQTPYGVVALIVIISTAVIVSILLYRYRNGEKDYWRIDKTVNKWS